MNTRSAKIAVWILCLLLFISVFADFIANEKPLYCKVDGKNYFPVFHHYAEQIGLAKPTKVFLNKEWQEIEYERVIYPLIPYSANTLDATNRYKSPFEEQKVRSRKFRHWLGTAHLGKDVAAGMIHGTRIAMLVGLISMSIAGLIGIFFGSLAGYFGDYNWRISRIRLLLWLLAIPLMLFYISTSYTYLFSDEAASLFFYFLIIIGIIGIFTLLISILANFLEKIKSLGKTIAVPIDIIIMRLIEVMQSIPALLLLLASLSVIENPSILYVMLVIGLIRWTGIARFLRAEFLRIRQLEYIKAAQAMGFKNWRIIFRHALPNALTPILITIAFGIAASILLEASLSFLGIGASEEEMSWGKMLSYIRIKPSAWWLAVFPGTAIFVTIAIFNMIGEGINQTISNNN